VVWVEGNHDEGLTDIMSALVGVQVYQEYAWQYGGVQHLAIHGHQFDRFVVNNLRLNHFWTVIYLKLQKLDLKGKPVARFIDRLNTRWLRMSSKVASGALLHAQMRGAARIFCGHTHEAMQHHREGIHYYNAGGWIDSRQTYITVGSEGVQIHEYQQRLDDGDSGKERGETDSGVAEFADESGQPEDAEYENIGG
jgi:UDP-2,3-diacylglucosamine pyrophosphatase LpxH